MLGGTIAMILVSMQAGGQSGTTAATGSTENPDQVICRRTEPRLGSRVATRRVCRTRAEWRAYDVDRDQLQRDLQNTPSPVATDF